MLVPLQRFESCFKRNLKTHVLILLTKSCSVPNWVFIFCYWIRQQQNTYIRALYSEQGVISDIRLMIMVPDCSHVEKQCGVLQEVMAIEICEERGH